MILTLSETRMGAWHQTQIEWTVFKSQLIQNRSDGLNLY